MCKFAAAASCSAADRTLRSITLSRNGGRFSVTGADGDSHWEAVLFVNAPKEAALDLQTGNGPIDAARVNGKLKVRATNGPLSLDQCSGTVDAETTNGPISMNAGSGDVVRLSTHNGPVSVSGPGGRRARVI